MLKDMHPLIKFSFSSFGVDGYIRVCGYFKSSCIFSLRYLGADGWNVTNPQLILVVL